MDVDAFKTGLQVSRKQLRAMNRADLTKTMKADGSSLQVPLLRSLDMFPNQKEEVIQAILDYKTDQSGDIKFALNFIGGDDGKKFEIVEDAVMRNYPDLYKLKALTQ